VGCPPGDERGAESEAERGTNGQRKREKKQERKYKIEMRTRAE